MIDGRTPVEQAIDQIEKLAFDLEPPNATTPQIVQACIFLRSELRRLRSPPTDEAMKVKELVERLNDGIQGKNDVRVVARICNEIMLQAADLVLVLDAERDELRKRLDEAERILSAILHTDERGQGVGYSDAMDAAKQHLAAHNTGKEE